MSFNIKRKKKNPYFIWVLKILLCQQGWMESFGWGPWFLRSRERTGQLHTLGRTQGIKGRESVQTQAQGWVISIDCASGRTPEDRGGCVCVCVVDVLAQISLFFQHLLKVSQMQCCQSPAGHGLQNTSHTTASLPTVNWRLSLLRGCQSMLIRFTLLF